MPYDLQSISSSKRDSCVACWASWIGLATILDEHSSIHTFFYFTKVYALLRRKKAPLAPLHKHHDIFRNGKFNARLALDAFSPSFVRIRKGMNQWAVGGTVFLSRLPRQLNLTCMQQEQEQGLPRRQRDPDDATSRQQGDGKTSPFGMVHQAILRVPSGQL